jgi:hypothetical protein
MTGGLTMKRIALAVLALVVGFGIYGWAQVVPAPSVPPGVLTGADIGFRVENTEPNRVVGRLMVRLNGRWVEAQFANPRRVFPLQAK